MPSQINVQLTGRIGNLIFYKKGNKYHIRTAPGKVNQTKATKKRAGEFGIASRMGGSLRQLLLPVIPFPADNKMQTRLVSALFQWLRSGYDPVHYCDDVPFVNNFQFNEGYSITERWMIPLLVTIAKPGLLELNIPAFVPVKAISAPAGTVSVKCNIAVAGCNVETGVATGGISTTLFYDYHKAEEPEKVVSLPVPTSAGSLVFTAISLEYNFIKNGHLEKTKNKAFMPAGIVSAMYF
jgi:hypothetical protein